MQHRNNALRASYSFMISMTTTDDNFVFSQVPQSGADVLPGGTGSDRRLRYYEPGHVRPCENMGERAAAAGESVDCDRVGGK